MVRLFVGVALLMAANSLLQKYRGYGFPNTDFSLTRLADGTWDIRTNFVGIFADPNDLAQLLATSVPFGFALIRRKSLAGALLGLAAGGIAVLAFLTTHSRGGAVGMAAMLAVLLVLLFPKRWTLTLMGLMALGGLLMTPFAEGHMDESAHDRVAFWGQANYAFKTHPIFGVGAMMIEEYISESRAVHNAYVLCYTELGVFGYWFWFGLVQLGLVGAWRARCALLATTEDEEWLQRFSGLCMAAVAGFSASNYFVGRAFLFPTYFLYALIAVIPILAEGQLDEDHPRLFKVGRDLFLGVTAASLLSIVYIYISIIVLNTLSYGS
jgi:O-antigen ligase